MRKTMIVLATLGLVFGIAYTVDACCRSKVKVRIVQPVVTRSVVMVQEPLVVQQPMIVQPPPVVVQPPPRVMIEQPAPVMVQAPIQPVLAPTVLVRERRCCLLNRLLGPKVTVLAPGAAIVASSRRCGCGS